MIKIVDKVIYLPKSYTGDIIDKNLILNKGFEELTKKIKHKIRSVAVGEKSATVTINGKASPSGIKYRFEIASDEDVELKEKIEAALSEWT